MFFLKIRCVVECNLTVNSGISVIYLILNCIFAELAFAMGSSLEK